MSMINNIIPVSIALFKVLPLTRISVNAFFYKSHNAGVLCITEN